MNVLHEMAIDAVHSLLQMNIEQMNRDAVRLLHDGVAVALAASFLQARLDVLRRPHGSHELIGSDILDNIARIIKQPSLAILFVNGPEDPAMAVKVRELGVPGLWIKLQDAVEEAGIRP